VCIIVKLSSFNQEVDKGPTLTSIAKVQTAKKPVYSPGSTLFIFLLLGIEKHTEVLGIYCPPLPVSYRGVFVSIFAIHCWYFSYIFKCFFTAVLAVVYPQFSYNISCVSPDKCSIVPNIMYAW